LASFLASPHPSIDFLLASLSIICIFSVPFLLTSRFVLLVCLVQFAPTTYIPSLCLACLFIFLYRLHALSLSDWQWMTHLDCRGRLGTMTHTRADILSVAERISLDGHADLDSPPVQPPDRATDVPVYP
jgi:hypothetical protein